MNITEHLEFELVYFKAAVKYFSHGDSPSQESWWGGPGYDTELLPMMRLNFEESEGIPSTKYDITVNHLF